MRRSFVSLSCVPMLLLLLLPSRSMAGNLVINGLYKDARVLVYEIPDDEGRANAVRDIGKVHDKFFSKLEMIDATKADDSALKEKLKGGFVLYTTMGEKSKLFKATTQPLHIQIDGGTLRWNGVTAPVSDLRVILVGKNPYGDGNCVVYAAGSNRLLVGINHVFHGPCSYHIFNGDKLLKEGNYNKDFVAGSDRIPQAEAIADVHQFFSTLQRVHPDLLAKVNVEEYVKLKQQTLDDVAKKLDADGKISMNDLAYMLYYAAAFFHDGHTSVNWQFMPNESNTSGKRFPPFVLGYDNGCFIVTRAGDKSLEGLEILSVNGTPIREFLSPILDRCSGETLPFKAARFTYNQPFWYCFSNLWGSAESLTLRLRDAKGKESELKVDTTSLADSQKLSTDARATELERLRQGTRVEFLDSGKIACLVYPAFSLSEDEKKKIDGIFQAIKEKRSQDLIIDIRDNGGGNSSMGDFIFSYLYGGKYRPFSKYRIELSRDVLSTFAKDGPIPKAADLEGMIVTERLDEQSYPKPNAFFSGRAFLLIDNGTFSSAIGFAAMFRDYGVGKIVGYETGGLPSCFGDVYPFELENSGIPCGVSWKQFFGPKPRPGDDEHGVLPDIPVNRKLLGAYQNAEDPTLAFTLDYVKKIRKSHGG